MTRLRDQGAGAVKVLRISASVPMSVSKVVPQPK